MFSFSFALPSPLLPILSSYLFAFLISTSTPATLGRLSSYTPSLIWLMPNRSYVHPSLHFKWTSTGSLGWIALPPRSSLMKWEASYLRRGWVERNSFLSWSNSESFIWPTELHILFHYGAMNILEFLYPEIKPLTPWAWSCILLHHKSRAHPWHLRGLLYQVAASLMIIWGLTPFWMVVFGFAYHNIFAGLVVVFVH